MILALWRSVAGMPSTVLEICYELIGALLKFGFPSRLPAHRRPSLPNPHTILHANVGGRRAVARPFWLLALLPIAVEQVAAAL